MKAISLTLMLCVAAAAGACSRGPQPPVYANVLWPGQEIEARNALGGVRVSYVSPTRRKYEWKGHSRVIDETVRPEPFGGELGVYDPAGAWFFDPRKRFVVRESIMDFADLASLHAFIYQSSRTEDWVYTPDGLMVGLGETPSRNQVSVSVHQLLVEGRRPRDLCGARPEQVRLRGAGGRDPEAVFAVAVRRFGLPALQQEMPEKTCQDILAVRLNPAP